MKRNLDLPITDMLGQPLPGGETLKDIAFMALSMQIRGDETLTGDQKMKLYVVAGKVVKGGVVELTTEDLALIKDRIGRGMTPIVMGKAFELLEQDYVEA